VSDMLGWMCLMESYMVSPKGYDFRLLEDLNRGKVKSHAKKQQ